MRAGDLHLSLEPGRKGPLYLQVAATILEAVRDRRILPGVALPGVRDLADRLGVTVNTILAALRELQDQGWLTSQERSGFFVADPLPKTRPVPPGAPAPLFAGLAPGYDLPAHLQPITSTANVLMDLTDGLADSRLAPSLALGRAYQRGLKLKGPKLLGASDFKGSPRLREALAEHLKAQREILASPEQILILRSTSMAVAVVAQALVGPAGGTVAVETPGNPLVWETLRQAGATLVPLPVDAEGVGMEALERLLEPGTVPPRLVVLTPQCQFPTGVGLSEPRRARLLELSRRHRFAILELDPEFDYLPVQGSRRPLASVDAGQVIYAGSLSRILAPGIRVSYVVAPEPLAGLLARARQHVDWQGDPVQEWALAELILEGELQRQLHRVRKAAQERREALEDALVHSMADTLAFDRHGAMALWLRGAGRLADPVRFGLWIRACQSRGLKLRLGKHYDLGGRDLAATRLGFTAFSPEELQRAVALMS